MDGIAKTAGVNKALLNYYYRSKEKMFQQIFEEDFGQFLFGVMKLLDGGLPLDVKIYKVVDMYTKMLGKNPDLPLFILSEIRENPDRLVHIISQDRENPFENLEEQLEQEFAKGRIKRTSVPMFLMNLLSLTVFPFLVKPVLSRVFQMDEESFQNLILERKKIVPKIIINTLLPIS